MSPTNEVEPPVLEQLLAVSHEQLRWTRAAATPQVRQTLIDVLDSTDKRRVYEMCDGNTTSTEISDELGVPKTTISTWTREWRNLGLATERKGRRIRHLVPPTSLGLKLEVAED